jgi:hypothetical protein
MMNRSQRLKTFLVVWLTMFSFIYLEAQNFYKQGIKHDFQQLCYPGSGAIINMGAGLTQSGIRGDSAIRYFNSVAPISSISIPPNLFYIQSGIMCKGEWKLEKATHIPFRFRLGSLADCDALEGKH